MSVVVTNPRSAFSRLVLGNPLEEILQRVDICLSALMTHDFLWSVPGLKRLLTTKEVPYHHPSSVKSVSSYSSTSALISN